MKEKVLVNLTKQNQFMNWFQQKAIQALTGLKHQDLFTLTGSQHRNLANGELTVIGFNGSTAQKSDEVLLTEGYEGNAQAYSIIRKISETGSDVPWVPKEVQSDGTLKDVSSGRFFEFVNQPNEEQIYLQQVEGLPQLGNRNRNHPLAFQRSRDPQSR